MKKKQLNKWIYSQRLSFESRIECVQNAYRIEHVMKSSDEFEFDDPPK